MDVHLYFSLIPEALIASNLPPEKFGQYYSTGSSYKSKGQSMFFEVDPKFRSEYFDMDTAIARCVPAADGTPKHSVYISVYRVLEHLPISALGKLYLAGRDVPRDREAAIRWLTLSAEQGNIYARFFLDHPDSFRDPSLFLAATRLLHHLSRVFREEQDRLPGGPHMQVESKLRRKIRQKKIAQGHAPDDHEQKLITY